MEIVNHMPEQEAQELGERLSRLRLPVKTLAERAGCDQATIGNHVRGTRQMSERVERDVMGELVAEELSVLTHLARLHPQAAIECAKAAPNAPSQAA